MKSKFVPKQYNHYFDLCAEIHRVETRIDRLQSMLEIALMQDETLDRFNRLDRMKSQTEIELKRLKYKQQDRQREMGVS